MAEQINRLNKITVLSIIREANEISRADIVKKSGLSAPTVTRIVDSLIHNEELAVQVGIGESSGGRPPMIVRFNGKDKYVIGIDWGRTHINGIIANLDGETVFNIDEPVSSENDFHTDLSKVIALINTLATQAEIDSERILGIGLAVAGFVNSGTGEVEYSPNFGWNKVDIRKELQESFKIPILIDNVSRVMSLGELRYGLGKTYQDFIFVNVGYGIGSGIIIGGKPFTGYDGFAGEIGHMKVRNCGGFPEGTRRCACGKNDCLECYVSGRGIAQTVKFEIQDQPQSLINKLCKGKEENITTELISVAAREGDSYAQGVLNDAATVLATSLANISNTLNPQAIIIGGKVALAGDFFIKRIREIFEKETLPNVRRSISLIKSDLIGEAGVKGAVALILNEVLELNVTT